MKKTVKILMLFFVSVVFLNGCNSTQSIAMPKDTILNGIEIKSLSLRQRSMVDIAAINGTAINRSGGFIQAAMISFAITDKDGVKVADAVGYIQNLKADQATRFVAHVIGTGEYFYMPKVELVDVQNMTQNNMVKNMQETTPNAGQVGIYVSDKTINNVVPGSPADVAGVKSGDVICNIAGQDISGWNATQVAKAIIGPKGEILSILVKRGEENISFDITRK